MESKEVAKEFLLSLKEDTTYVESQKIEETNAERGGDLKTISFTDLNIPVSLAERLFEKRFDRASYIQQQVIPLILEGKSVSVQSQSGSGKTYAFAIAILSRIVPDKTPQVLVITPTKELSRQITEEINSIAKSVAVSATNLNSGDGFRGISEICVGCPGTILNSIEKFLQLKFVVIDEADFTLNPFKMGKETLTILKYIKAQQRLYFSATYSNRIKQLIHEIENNSLLDHYNSELIHRISPVAQNHIMQNQGFSFQKTELVTIYEPENKKPDTIKLFHTFVKEEDKIQFLLSIFEFLPISQLIIFVSRKDKIEKIRKKFSEENYNVLFIHGDMDLEQRKNFVSDFVNGKSKILISTDLFSRGMDIPLVNAVINFDLPITSSGADTRTYIHRVGRCGRFGRKGFVLDFCANEQDTHAIVELSNQLEYNNKFFLREDLEKAWMEIEQNKD